MDLEIAQSDRWVRDSSRVGLWLCVAAMLIVAPLSATAQEAAGETAAEVQSKPARQNRPAGQSAILPVEFGFKAGASRSLFVSDQGLAQESLTFVSGGLVLRWQFAGPHGLQTGVSYVRKGATTIGLERNVSNIDYLQVPLLYRIAPRALTTKASLQPYAVIGPYVGYNVAQGGDLEMAELSTLDFGATIGVGVSGHITPTWIVDVEVEYNRGLTDIFSSDLIERNNRAFMVSIGFTLDLGGDYDKDGLLNRKETRSGECWVKAEDYDGWEDDDGCPEFDNDQDETPDKFDQCMNVAEDRDGHASLDGCPDSDNDQDGIADYPDKVDMCPDEPYWLPFDKPGDGYKREKHDGPSWMGRQYGCPGQYKKLYVEATGCETRLKLITPIARFDKNGASFSPGHKAVLDEVSLFLNHYPWIKLEVRGHLSQGEKRGTDQQRAESARKYLIDKGIGEARLVSVARGDLEPFYQDYPPPRAVKKPAEWTRRDQQRLKELEDKVNLAAIEGIDIQSANYEYARRQIDALNKRRRAIEKQQKAYQQYQERLAAYEQLMQGAQNADRNRRVTFGIQGQ